MIPAGRRTERPTPAGTSVSSTWSLGLAAGILAPTGSLALAAGILACVLGAVPADAGTLSGHIRYEGPAPGRPTITMSADLACDRLFPKGRPTEVVVVDAGGGLANVLVHVTAGLPDDFRSAAPTTSAVIDQEGCAFVPHVLGVRAGQEIEIRNRDATSHDVDAKAAFNTPFHETLPARDIVIRKAFERPEVAVKLKSDNHPWMSAYVGVFSHPFFFVTGPDGTFTIAGLPRGDYTVEAWHESLGRKSAKVSIDKEGSATLDFSFAGN